MLLTPSKDLYEKAKRFRSHGIDADYKTREEVGSFHYDMVDLGYNYRLSDVHCALGISQLSKLNTWVSRRITIAAAYDAALCCCVIFKCDAEIQLKFRIIFKCDAEIQLENPRHFQI